VHSLGVLHVVYIDGKWRRRGFELNEAAVQAFVDAAVELEQDPESSKNFAITPELTLVCKPKLALFNCEAQFEFASLEYLGRLVDRILEGTICAEFWSG